MLTYWRLYCYNGTVLALENAKKYLKKFQLRIKSEIRVILSKIMVEKEKKKTKFR